MIKVDESMCDETVLIINEINKLKGFKRYFPKSYKIDLPRKDVKTTRKR